MRKTQRINASSLILNLCILSSATTALSTLCQGRLYHHVHLYIYINLLIERKGEITTLYYKTVPKCLANPLSSGAWNTEQLRFLLEADRSSICHQVFPRMPARTRQLILFFIHF